MKVAALTAPVTVEADGDGGLVTHGLALDPAADPQHWVPRQPGLFTTADGQHRIAFDGHGLMVGTGPEATAYERLSWYQDPTLHLIAFGFGRNSSTTWPRCSTLLSPNCVARPSTGGARAPTFRAATSGSLPGS